MKTIIEQEKIEENKELLDLIREDFYRINPAGCNDFFKRRDRRIPCLPVLKKKFNNASYNDILQYAGIEDTNLHYVRRNREEILIKLRRIIESNGIPPVSRINEFGMTSETIVEEFGSYEEGIKKAVNQEVMVKKFDYVKESDEELLQMYIEFSYKIGKGDTGASGVDLNRSNEIYNAGIFMIRFGGMNELRKLAGFFPKYNGKIVYQKENIIQGLTKKIISKGNFLTAKEIVEDTELPAFATILRHFKTTKISQVNKEMIQIIKEKDYELYKKLNKNQL